MKGFSRQLLVSQCRGSCSRRYGTRTESCLYFIYGDLLTCRPWSVFIVSVKKMSSWYKTSRVLITSFVFMRNRFPFSFPLEMFLVFFWGGAPFPPFSFFFLFILFEYFPFRSVRSLLPNLRFSPSQVILHNECTSSTSTHSLQVCIILWQRLDHDW